VTSPGIQPVTAQAAASASGEGAARQRPGLNPGTAWTLGIPAVVTLVITLWGITGASYWRDEAATMSAAQRPLGNLLRTLGNIDAVHGAYYLLIWVVVKLGGTGELATRLPSAVAMAVAAAAVALLGGRLVSRRAGLAAGLVFAVLPPVSLYGQDARPYAITVALATIASYLLVRAMAADVSSGRYKWFAGYGACVAALGIVDIFGLLLVLAHAVTVALRCVRLNEAGASDEARSLALGWLAAAVAGVGLASPLLAFAFVQRGTLSWLTAPSFGAVRGLHELIGPAYMADAVVLAVACGIVVSALRGGPVLRASWPGSLPALCLPWLIVPPAILLIGSLVTPLYTFRYVLLCMPAIALLAGAGLASLGWLAGAAALVVIALLGVPQQRQVRGPDGHGDNIRQADRIVAEHMRPSDAVLEFKAENFAQAYPYGIRKLNPIALAKGPVKSATLIGTFLPDPVVREKLTHISRVWVVEYGHPAPLVILNGLHFHLVHAWQTSDIWLFLYAQSP
jgi:mannosyltransferase